MTNKSAQVLGTTISLFILTTLAVSLRLASRKISGAGFWVDDYFIGIAQISFIVCCVDGILLYSGGLGKHDDEINININTFIKITWAGEFSYQVVACAYKLSIAFMYYRIFVLKGFRIALNTTTALICAYSIWSILQTFLQCLPISANWHFVLQPGDRCIPTHKHLLSLAISNVVLDWLLLFLPIPVVWKLQMSLLHKLEVSAVLVIGGLVCVIAIVRFVVVLRFSDDVAYNYASLYLWSLSELAVGIICPCLITLRPILRRIFPRSFDSARNGLIAGSPRTNLKHVYSQKPSSTFHRLEQSAENEQVGVTDLTYHTVIAREVPRSESDAIPLTGIRVIRDVNVDSRGGDF